MDNVIGQIDRALDMTGAIVAVAADRLAASAPHERDVRTMLNHTVGGMYRFTAALSGTDAGAERENDWLGGDPQGAFAAAAEMDRAAWRRPDALTGTVPVPMGDLPGQAAAMVHLAEMVVHGVDLAVALNRPDLADEELCAEVLATMYAMGGIDGLRTTGIFDEEVVVPEDAPAHRRLLGYVGRTLVSS